MRKSTPKGVDWSISGMSDVKGGETMSEKSGYIGTIKNTGTQVVKAPNQTTLPKKATMKTGKDLRTGKK